MAAVIELVRKRDEEPPVNPDLIAMLFDLLAMAEAGEIQAAGVVYVTEGQPLIAYEAEGHEAAISTAARQLDAELRASIFEDE